MRLQSGHLNGNGLHAGMPPLVNLGRNSHLAYVSQFRPTTRSAPSALRVDVEKRAGEQKKMGTRPIPQARNPQQEQQGRFIQENLRRIFLQIFRIVGNVEDAQDLTQEAFIKALQHGEQLKDMAKAAHWLSRIASNTAIDFLRRSGRVTFTDLADMPEPAASGDHDPELGLLRAEESAYLDEGLKELTERERLALILRDVEGYSAEEVAERLGCSKATVRSHIANARVKFRRYVERNPV